MRIYMANERVPKGRRIYGLYMVDGHQSLIIENMMFMEAAIFGDVVPKGGKHWIPIGFVFATDMMKLIKDNITISLNALADVGKFQAIWYEPQKK